jgi:hypothetical protein
MSGTGHAPDRRTGTVVKNGVTRTFTVSKIVDDHVQWHPPGADVDRRRAFTLDLYTGKAGKR